MVRFAAAALLAALCFASPGFAATCANGAYAAGCAGPNGAAVVRKPPAPYYRPPSHYAQPHRTCVNGVYRAGCAGPNGAGVVRKP